MQSPIVHTPIPAGHSILQSDPQKSEQKRNGGLLINSTVFHTKRAKTAFFTLQAHNSETIGDTRNINIFS